MEEMSVLWILRICHENLSYRLQHFGWEGDFQQRWQLQMHLNWLISLFPVLISLCEVLNYFIISDVDFGVIYWMDWRI